MTLPEPPQENLNTRHLSLPSETAPGDISTTGPLDLQRPWVIEFRVVGTASTVKARVTDAMILGRGDTTSGYTPEVDLTLFDAFAKGVSRKHALMSIKDQRLMLRDLNSTNGTRLNNVLCTPGEEYRVRHGNELTLGTLRLQVSFAVVPAFTDTQHGTNVRQAVHALAHVAGKHLMVVESDPDMGGVFRSALENVGYKVTLVDDVVKGFGVVFQGMPDAIVLDMMEPDATGLDLIRFVRKQLSPQHIPILAISGALAGFQMNQALSAGADSFLGKPVSVEALLDAVAKAWTPQPAAGLGDKVTGPLEKPPAPSADAPFAAPAPTVFDMPPGVFAAPPPPAGQIKLVEKAAPPQESAKPVATPPAPPVAPTKPTAAPPQVPARPVDKVIRPDAPQEMAKPLVLPVKPEPPVVPKPDVLSRINPFSPRL